MGTDRMNKNLSGLPMYHLRRIGPPPNKDRVINVMDLYRVTYMIGRSEVQVDFYIDSSNHIQSASISRCHARVVRQNGNQHRLYDDSLNGVFVNNIKIAGSCVLREGDKVTFGHPCGARLPAGSRARQPDSHHQFMVNMSQYGKVVCETKKFFFFKETTGFKKPVSPAEASGSNSTRRPKKPTRKPTQCFTSDDVKQLKAAWEERQSSSASDISDDSASEAENEPRLNIARKSVVVADEQSTETNSHSEEDKSVEAENYKKNGTSTDKQSPSKQSPCKSKSYNTESPGVMPKDIEMFSESDEDSRANDNSHTAVTSDVNHETVKLCRLTETDISPENDLNEQTDICSEHITSKSPEKNDISALEGTVNSIMKDLCDLRGKIENSVEQSGHEVPIVFKSPTKDACIQTSQSENVNGEVGIRYVTASPTKDMGIQTSQIFPPQAVSSHVVETTVDEKFQTCNELASGTSDFDDVETMEKTDDTTSLTGITATSNGSELDDEESTEKSNDTIQEDFEPAQEGCNEELNKETEFNETPHIEDTCKSNESESTVEEYATSMVLPDLDISEAFSNFAENELKQCSAKGENNECVYIKSKHQQQLNDNSNEFIEEDQISEENQSKQPSLILSDSVVYEADEENDDPDLFFSNSIEYSGSESDRNLSESETEEVDMDTKESSNDSEESENCDGEEDDNNTGGDDTCKSEDFINSDDNSLRKCSESEHGVNADNDKVGAAHENSENQSEGSVNVECRSDARDLFKNSLNKMEIVSIEDISFD
ncbi:uncharacterized protein LOC132713474 [Ruditapes philippinarum]|uniref:uncharacterized protein LOC132713474 n=1 Tax=Ruditapes philippinarum TaxID=129788 RepID=UPI00295AC101|nr:uncharacterized protein LOC132713474 [Ruditapes philippinarum]